MNFSKYSGNGNDFIILDHPDVIPNSQQIQKMCDRNFGIGADGVLIYTSEPHLDGRMRIFNADGGEAEMCANGLRCLFTYLDGQATTKKQRYTLATMNGVYSACKRDHKFAVEMCEVKDKNLAVIPPHPFEKAFTVNTGVPHLIFLGKKIRELDFIQTVRPFRYHPNFPKGTNVSLVEVLPEEKSAYVRTYERGVEDETFSCGTGLTASALALSHWLGWQGDITLFTKGGKQMVQVGDHILYSGEVTFCFKGAYPL
jgi:diaminopimelate epimerase